MTLFAEFFGDFRQARSQRDFGRGGTEGRGLWALLPNAYEAARTLVMMQEI